MMEGITAGFISWSSGRWRDDAPHLTVAEVPAGRGRVPGLLAVLVELAGGSQGRDATAARLVAAAQQAYSETSGTITLALRRAVEAANAALYQANAGAPREQRRHGGMSCVLVTDGDVYIGQAGPAVVYLTQAGALQRFPADSPWLSTSPQTPVGTTWTPLGVRPVVPVNLFHCPVGAEDSVALATSNLPRLIEPGDLEAALDQDPQIVMRALSALSAAGQDFSVLLLQMPPAERRQELVLNEVKDDKVTRRQELVLNEVQDDKVIRPDDVTLSPRHLVTLSSSLAGLGRLIRHLLPERAGSADRPLLAGAQRRKLLAGLALAFPLFVVVFTILFYLQQQGRF
jgi:hypothetical protein